EGLHGRAGGEVVAAARRVGHHQPEPRERAVAAAPRRHERQQERDGDGSHAVHCGGQPIGITPSAIATASMTSEHTPARQITFFWWSVSLTGDSETSSSIAGASGLFMCTGWPMIDARAISTGAIP